MQIKIDAKIFSKEELGKLVDNIYQGITVLRISTEQGEREPPLIETRSEMTSIIPSKEMIVLLIQSIAIPTLLSFIRRFFGNKPNEKIEIKIYNQTNNPMRVTNIFIDSGDKEKKLAEINQMLLNDDEKPD